MSITRGQLRRRIAGRLGDVTDLVATANGSTTTLVDTIRLSGLIEGPGNRDIVFTSGTNLGLSRRITTYNLGTGTLTFAAVTSTVTNDTAEMYNFRGRGWRKEEYDDAINQALLDSWPLFRVRNTVSIVSTFDASTGLISISGIDLTHISGVAWQDTGGIWQDVESAMTSRGQGWTVDQSLAVIDVRGGVIPNGSTVRVTGFKAPTALTTDSSTTSINPEWLTHRACQILCMAAVDRDTANYNLGMVFGQQADSLKASIRTRLPSGTVAVAP